MQSKCDVLNFGRKHDLPGKCADKNQSPNGIFFFVYFFAYDYHSYFRKINYVFTFLHTNEHFGLSALHKGFNIEQTEKFFNKKITKINIMEPCLIIIRKNSSFQSSEKGKTTVSIVEQGKRAVEQGK